MKLYTGCVENRQDPLKLGRCQVRVVGLHNYDKTQLKTEDLPWAYPMQPITSAGISGVGHTPLGPVEGSWVVVMFRDDDEQQPIILGTVGGIPQQQGTIDQDDDQMVLKSDGMLPGSDGQTTTDNNGNTVTNTSATPIEESTGLNAASSYKASQDAVDLIKQFEGKRNAAYQDSVGIWTIGYGTTNINGSPVGPGMTISDAQAEQYLLDHINTQVVPAIQRVKAPITQSMFDAMCCLTYNIGNGAFGKSTLKQDCDATNYTQAATSFMDWNKAGGKILPGLTRRRSAEQTLFLKDGVPNISGVVTPVNTPPVDPVGSNPISPSGMPSNGSAMVAGFKDPKGKYPLYLNEPDTNKLARHEDIKKTIVYKKELAREKGVPIPGATGWDQARIPYNTTYPFNKVFMSESGHVMEFDDTENSERIHLYHKTGTYMEIDANGTKVTRIVGDKYEILERNGFVYVKGAANVTIEGNSNVLIKNNMNLDVYGNVNMNVSGNMNTAVTGSYNVKAGSINLESTGITNIFSGNSVNVQSAAAQSFKAGATFNVDAVRVDLNSGTAGSANQTGLTIPEAQQPEQPVFNDLIVITRGVQAAAHYETPEEGDPSEYQAKQIADGTLDPADINSGTAKGSAAAPANDVKAAPQSCEVIYGMAKFSADLQLSDHFTLGSLTSNGTRMPVDQVGLTAQQIVCNLKGLAENCLEPIIKMYPSMIITSSFRRPGDVAKSSATSQHYNGQAADIIIPGFNRQKMYDAIQAIQQVIPYDQLILEYSGATTCWIHCSFSYNNPRKTAFTMRDHRTYPPMGQFTLIA